jgi:chemotaxis protein histidine kinase CheA
VDRIKQMLDTISDLTDDEVVELQSAIVSEFETVEGEDPTPETVEKMTTLADMLDTVRGESKRRQALAQELAARAAEAANRVKGAMEEDAEAPEAMDEEEKEEVPAAPAMEEEESKMSEASTATEEVSELSTEEAATEVVAEAATEVVAEAATEVEPAAEAAVEATDAAVETEATAELAVEEVAVEAPAEELSVEAAQEETPEVSTEASAEVEVEAELSTTTEIAQDEQEGQEAPMTAAAEEGQDVEVQAPADRRPNIQAAQAPVVITAGADIPGYTAGAQMADYTEIAEAMASRLHGLRRVKGGDGEQHIVASITTKYTEDRILTQDTDSNIVKIKNVASPEAIVASGGHSTPFEVKYDIFGFGTTVRPIRDSLPRFQADRGGIRYIVPPVLSSYADAVGVWTNVVDTDPGTDTKASLTVAAATETTVATDAVTLQLQFGNLMTRAYPELIARHNELALIQHAREAEQYLASKLTAGSTAVTSTSLIGVARDFLVQVGRAASAYRSRHRLDADMPLRVLAPSWIKDAMVADLALSMPGDSTLNAYGEVEGYLAARGVNITFSPDLNVAGAQSTGAMNEFSDTFTWYMFSEGTFLFLDGGTLDLGIIRDSTLVGTNDYKMFVETFEGIAKVGIESLVVTSTISVNGVAAALRDTTGGATAAAIEY